MSKLRIGAKALRTGTFLFGLRDARVVSALEPFGFDEEATKEGWDLFFRVTQQRLSRDVRPTKNSPAVVAIDAFEDKWFPLAKVILSRHHEDVADEFFANLTREDGKVAAYSVANFVARLDAMSESRSPFEEHGAQARDYLRKRGLTDEVVADVQAQLDKLQEVKDPALVRQPSPEEREAAEVAMWKWYREWSGIARRVITSASLLRTLGFKKRKARGDDDEDIEIVDTRVVAELPEASQPPALPAGTVQEPIAAE